MTQMASLSRADELVRRLTAVAGSNIQSVVLYGSGASSDFDPKRSDLNVLCILRDSSLSALQALAPVVHWWTGKQQPVPLFMTAEELERSADVFAIEFLDMRQHYRVLFGVDMLKDLQVPMALHRVQVEYELREKLLLLRQRLVAIGNNKRQLRKLLLDSLPSFLTLFRHAAIALGEPAPSRREAVQGLASRVGFDPAAIASVLDARDHKVDLSKIDVEALFASYLHIVEQVASAVDRMLDEDKSTRRVP
jgi:hypothetical protein